MRISIKDTTISIPKVYELDHTYIDQKINEALKVYDEKNIKSKDVTPFLLSVVHKSTKGKSVVANKVLVFNNVKLAIQIAIKLKDTK